MKCSKLPVQNIPFVRRFKHNIQGLLYFLAYSNVSAGLLIFGAA